MKRKILFILGITLFALSVSFSSCNKNTEKASISTSTSPSFSWDNATVYFVYIDRFLNGSKDNDHNYNRKSDYGSVSKNVATFHGGDILGLTQKLKEGYFTSLGINVIWVTGVYEQIHGWVGGGDKNDFPHYAYHGYYPMDFTAMDKNFGTIEEFRTFVDLAHGKGIRVMMDAGINHPGYLTLLDAIQYNFGGVGLSEKEASEHIEGISNNSDAHYKVYAYLEQFQFDKPEVWKNWWGKQWIRSQEEVDKDVLTESIFGLPDFRTESKTPVALPLLLQNKWRKEGGDFDTWVNPSAKKYRKDLNIAQSDYVIKWLASWVEEFGIDGFRCDVLENVDTFRWEQLNKECNQALATWRKNHPNQSASKWNDCFWMTGDIWDAGIEYYPEYAKSGFSSIVNFTFPKDGNLEHIGKVWQKYADSLNTKDNDWTTLSFLNNTYKRDTKSDNMINCGTTLLLSPGAIQIFYGDEVGRNAIQNQASDPTHGYRSDYIWGQNPEVLAHWQKLGKFREGHLSVGAGTQRLIAENTFLRIYKQGNFTDKVIIKIAKKGEHTVTVKDIFPDDTQLRNAYSGESAIVKNGQVKFQSESGIMLIEETK